MVRMPLIVLGGLALLAAGGPVQAQCGRCVYKTVYRPVLVRHCAHFVPRITRRVARYSAVRVVQPAYLMLAPLSYYDRFGYAYGYRVVPPRVNAVVYNDPSYGLIARE